MEEPVSRKIQSRLAWRFAIGFISVSLVLGSLLHAGVLYLIFLNLKLTFTHFPRSGYTDGLVSVEWALVILPLFEQIAVVVFCHPLCAFIAALLGLERRCYDPQRILIVGAIAGGVTSVILAGIPVTRLSPLISNFDFGYSSMFAAESIVIAFVVAYAAALTFRFRNSQSPPETQGIKAIT